MRPAENTEKTPQKLLWINYINVVKSRNCGEIPAV